MIQLAIEGGGQAVVGYILGAIVWGVLLGGALAVWNMNKR